MTAYLFEMDSFDGYDLWSKQFDSLNAAIEYADVVTTLSGGGSCVIYEVTDDGNESPIVEIEVDPT